MYEVVFLNKRIEKAFYRLPQAVVRRIAEAMLVLETNPLTGPNIRRLQGGTNGYRLRVGDYRVLYFVEASEVRVVVIRISIRGGAYKGM